MTKTDQIMLLRSALDGVAYARNVLRKSPLCAEVHLSGVQDAVGRVLAVLSDAPGTDQEQADDVPLWGEPDKAADRADANETFVKAMRGVTDQMTVGFSLRLNRESGDQWHAECVAPDGTGRASERGEGLTGALVRLSRTMRLWVPQ